MAAKKRAAGKARTFTQRAEAVLRMSVERRARAATELRLGLDAVSEQLRKGIHCARLVGDEVKYGGELLQHREPETLAIFLASAAEELNAVVSELDRRLRNAEVRS